MGRLPGPPGPPGPQGPAGPAGPAGGGAIIPYASGTPFTLTAILGGAVGTVGLVGFGSSATTILTGTQIILVSPPPAALLDYAFSAPRAGTITSIAAFFSTALAIALPVGATLNITAQLYRAPATSNTFDPIPGTALTLISDTLISRNIATGLAIPVAAEDRLMMVFSISVTGVPSTFAGVSLNGVASAGVNIV